MHNSDLKKLVRKVDERVLNALPIQESDRKKYIRRINKLKRDPIGFLRGSFNKRSFQVRKLLPVKYIGSSTFTVVSAVYNVEEYLDDYFESLVNQTLSFKSSIRVILVDDGSTDDSAAIIKKWQKKYPHNITYFYKENGGQASARNLGLSHVKTEWVTFIDPDDRIDISFFHNIDKVIVRNSSVRILSTYIKLLSEDGVTVRDKHPLRHRFISDTVVFEINEIGSYINLSAASTIFNYNIISKYDLKFDEKLNVSFEDAKFIFNYISYLNSGLLIHVTKSIYFYRKHRQSTTALSWVDKRKYTDTFKYGYLDSLEMCREFPNLETLIKNTVLYDINNYLNFLLDKPESLYFLGDEVAIFYELLVLTIREIDNERLVLESNISYVNKAFILYYMRKGINSFLFLPTSYNNQKGSLYCVFREKCVAMEFIRINGVSETEYSLSLYCIGSDKLTLIGFEKSNLSKLVINI